MHGDSLSRDITHAQFVPTQFRPAVLPWSCSVACATETTHWPVLSACGAVRIEATSQERLVRERVVGRVGSVLVAAFAAGIGDVARDVAVGVVLEAFGGLGSLAFGEAVGASDGHEQGREVAPVSRQQRWSAR